MPKSATFMIYKGDGKTDADELAAVTISSQGMELYPRAQLLHLRDKDGNTFAMLTWKSTVHVREVGK